MREQEPGPSIGLIDAERDPLLERGNGVPWLRWGRHLSERQWGTVREHYIADGDAWAFFPHDHARSRAYRRGKDGKEYYFYLDNTPTHSYMKYLYKYPHTAYPYDDLVATNGRRSVDDYEYELIDTGAFAEDRYFDVGVEYAKGAPDDILIAIETTNRGPEPASLAVLPTVWFRNTWSEGTQPRPALERMADLPDATVVRADHDAIGRRFLYAANRPATLFCDNESNVQRLFGEPNASQYVKDGIGEAVRTHRPQLAARFPALGEPGTSIPDPDRDRRAERETT